MDDSLHFLACSTYQREFETIIQSEGWKAIQLHTFPQACIHSQLRKQAAEQIRLAGEKYDSQSLFVCKCFAVPDTIDLGLSSAQICQLDQCFYMLTSRHLVDHLIKQGAYLLTPGWLDNWRSHLERWGFDQTTGRKFFQECTKKFILLDTLVNAHSPALLQELGEYLDLPVETLPIGLDFLRLYFSQKVNDWQHKISLRNGQKAIAEINRNAADYAMAFDLLTKLSQVKNEAEVVELIMDLFTMLFSPGTIAYYPMVENEIMKGLEVQLDEEGQNLIQRWVQEKSEDYFWTSSGIGFFLRFHFHSETMGILRIDALKLPQYKNQYLNLALSIANLCALSIINARTFQKLQETEAIAQWEKEISETLREILSELTLQLDLDELLKRILISLSRVTPYSDAAVSLLNGDQLIFVAGHRISKDGQPAQFHMPDLPLSLASLQQHDQTALIDVLSNNTIIQEYLGGEKLLSWINVPLMLRGALAGFLSMGDRIAHAYSPSDVLLAQSFADEVSIAIENARLFKEIQALAVTDGLTGLYNRRHFYHLAIQEFVRSSRYNRPLSMIMLDVDLFKRINDFMGI